MKVRIKIGQCYITRSVLPGETDLYVSISSGMQKAKSKVKEGLTPNFNQVVELVNEGTMLTVKVKDVGMHSCLGSAMCATYNPFKSLVA